MSMVTLRSNERATDISVKFLVREVANPATYDIDKYLSIKVTGGGHQIGGLINREDTEKEWLKTVQDAVLAIVEPAAKAVYAEYKGTGNGY